MRIYSPYMAEGRSVDLHTALTVPTVFRTALRAAAVYLLCIITLIMMAASATKVTFASTRHLFTLVGVATPNFLFQPHPVTATAIIIQHGTFQPCASAQVASVFKYQPEPAHTKI